MIKHQTLTRSAAAVLLLLLLGCDKKDSSTDVNGSVDQKFVGVWYDASDQSGAEVRTDGTFRFLMLDNTGALVYDTTTGHAAYFNSAANGRFQMTETMLERYSGRDTTLTYVSAGKYLFSNSDLNLTLFLETVNGHAEPDTMYLVRKSIGEFVATVPIPTAAVSLTFQSVTYNFNAADVMMNGAKLYFQATSTSYPNSNLVVTATRTLGGHALPFDASINVLISGAQYIGSSGTVTISSITGKNTKGTLAGYVVLPTNPGILLPVSGSFDVTLP